MFIVFEGLDNSGKTSQIPLVDKFLSQRGYKTFVTYQPNNDLGLRDILLDNRNYITPYTELFLYLADKSHNVSSVIKPKIKQGYTVICDRYIASTIAYQGYGRELPIDEVTESVEFATDYLKADITVYLDIHPRDVLRRKYKKLDRMEGNDIEFYERVREGYMKICNSNNSWIYINGALEFNEVTKEICQKLIRKLC